MSDERPLPDPEPVKDNNANDKKKGGRPKKTEEEKQKNVVVVRFSAAVFAQLESHARVKGQTLAGVVKKWMAHGRPTGLTAEQHANVRCLPQISNDLKAIAELLKQQSGREDQTKAEELLFLQEQLGQLLTSFQR
jgi:transposase